MEVTLKPYIRYRRGKRRTIIINKGTLTPQIEVLLIIKNLQAQVTRILISGFRKSKSPILTFWIGTTGFWVLKRKVESRRASAPIAVGSIVLRPVSKGLRASLPNKKADFPARKKPE
ncbi:hypothetical protein O181_016490 [Austropuccinia psidii MF-1]|uniref:Uncharacterized protein n=1 Tax=Austropuccinia psidii MF-1 TaxID=1389203 RepID=A0A9Q3C5Y0_9BASI|nr:hypothetical protein [Austropuccinia psidii MF-1]